MQNLFSILILVPNLNPNPNPNPNLAPIPTPYILTNKELEEILHPFLSPDSVTKYLQGLSPIEGYMIILFSTILVFTVISVIINWNLRNLHR